MLYFSDIIQHLLIDRKKQKKEIAEKCGLLPASFSRMINKPDNNFQIDTLCNIFKALDCDITVNITDSATKQILYSISSSDNIDKQ